MFGQPQHKSWYFESEAHAEAVNRLLYVAEQGESFVLLTAEHGAGKSTVLDQVRNECIRLGHSALLLNVAALDENAFLWHLCGGLSIAPNRNQSRSEMMAAIRDELSGRGLCNRRTVIILDDLHACSEDLSLMIQFLGAVNQQSDGAAVVVAAAESSLSPELQKLSALRVQLPLLDVRDAHDFVTGMLRSLGVDSNRVTGETISAIVTSGSGSPAQLGRICELLYVAESANQNLVITPDVLAALTNETLHV